MIPTWIGLPAEFWVCSNNLSSETASSLGALAEVLGSALLDSHHIDAHCSRRGIRLAYMNPANWAWETVGSSRKIDFISRRRENVCMHTGLTLYNPWTAARQAPLSMGFPRQEHWSGVAIYSSRASSRPRDQSCVCLCLLHFRQILLPSESTKRMCT